MLRKGAAWVEKVRAQVGLGEGGGSEGQVLGLGVAGIGILEFQAAAKRGGASS